MVLAKTLYFPFFGLLNLRRRRSEHWADIVDRVSTLSRTDPEVIAFSLLMKRLRSETVHGGLCHDNFCATCAARLVDTYSGSEQDLITLYYRGVDEVKYALQDMKARGAARREQRRAA